MKYAIVYSSLSGNTKQIAQAIYSVLPKEECIYFGDVKHADVSQAEFIICGSWSDKGDCSSEMMEFINTLSKKHLALFLTAGFGASSQYFDAIMARMLKHVSNDCDVINTFVCQGKMPLSVKLRYQKLLLEEPGNKQYEMMIQNFDSALSHPDENDEKAAQAFAQAAYDSLL